MLHLAIFLAMSAVIGNCFAQNERIIGGKDATYVPWVVALVFYGNGSVYDNQFCGGSIINESWVLTAAHCTYCKDPSEFYIIAGIINLDDTTKGQIRYIKSIENHNKFDKATVMNDISVLKLRSPLELNNNVAVIDLANEVDPLENDQEYTIGGWGSVSGLWNAFPNTFQVLEGVPHYRMGKCIGKLKNINRKRHICAGCNPGYDSCAGDSGGPLWMAVDDTPLLYGITSWGKDCATSLPGVYTKVSFFRRWIEKKVKFSLSNPCICAVQGNSCVCYK